MRAVQSLLLLFCLAGCCLALIVHMFVQDLNGQIEVRSPSMLTDTEHEFHFEALVICCTGCVLEIVEFIEQSIFETLPSAADQLRL